MFDVPGFTPSSFTDDELMKKQMNLNQKLVWANRFGSMEACNQINAMISAIESERRERILKLIFKERGKLFPSIIETDPDLSNENRMNTEEKEKTAVNNRKVNRDRMITRTSSPVLDKHDKAGE